MLDCGLDALWRLKIFDVDNRPGILLTFDLEVHIDAQLVMRNQSFGDLQSLQQFLEFTDDQLRVIWVSNLGLGIYLE